MQKVKKLSFFNFISMSRRLYRGSKYFTLGIISFLLLINLIDILDSFSIDCNGGILPCAFLVDILIYISVLLILVGAIKLILFFWKDYKLIEKIKKFKSKYLDKKTSSNKKEITEGKCEICNTVNDKDAVFCKKCAASLKDETNEELE
jgi:hypothetical protein